MMETLSSVGEFFKEIRFFLFKYLLTARIYVITTDKTNI